MSVELVDYRRRVFEQYRQAREARDAEPAVRQWREERDQLFHEHPQSPLDAEQKQTFQSLSYFPYNSQWRKLAHLDYEVDEGEIEVQLRDDGVLRMRPLAIAHWQHENLPFQLTLYSISGYGGGLFLPFRDLSHNSGKVYAGTRYLLDTIKGADFGMQGEQLVLDFNYAYNPSCAYNADWDCPLAPQQNWLELEVLAGEKLYPPQ